MRRIERLSQKLLALELRAAIDIAMARPAANHIETIRGLIEEHPHGSASRHVAHNLGDLRLDWLYENGLLSIRYAR